MTAGWRRSLPLLAALLLLLLLCTSAAAVAAGAGAGAAAPPVPARPTVHTVIVTDCASAQFTWMAMGGLSS